VGQDASNVAPPARAARRVYAHQSDHPIERVGTSVHTLRAAEYPRPDYVLLHISDTHLIGGGGSLSGQWMPAAGWASCSTN
jgi:hypothetical protein